MRALLPVLVLAAAATACSSVSSSVRVSVAEPAPIAAAGKSGGIVAAATLAPVGSFEWHASPVFTKLSIARRRAAADLDADRITLPVARQVQAMADEVRKILERAIAAEAGGNGAEAHRALLAADAAADQVSEFLRRSRR